MQELRRRVGGQVEAVEAGVSAREGLHATPALDAEPAGARGASQRREPFVRDRGCARHELDQTEPLLVGKPVTEKLRNIVRKPVYIRIATVRGFATYVWNTKYCEMRS